MISSFSRFWLKRRQVGVIPYPYIRWVQGRPSLVGAGPRLHPFEAELFGSNSKIMLYRIFFKHKKKILQVQSAYKQICPSFRTHRFRGSCVSGFYVRPTVVQTGPFWYLSKNANENENSRQHYLPDPVNQGNHVVYPPLFAIPHTEFRRFTPSVVCR